MDYDATAQTCTLNFKQSCPDTPESNNKAPFLIPFSVSLLNSAGMAIALELEDKGDSVDGMVADDSRMIINLTKAEQSVCFVGVPEKSLPSLLGDFSAPVKYDFDYSVDDYIFLMQHDSDDFNRWEASQRLALSLMLEMLEDKAAGRAIGVSPQVVDAYQLVLENESLDHALRAEALSLPGESDIADAVDRADPQAIHEVREYLIATLANGMRIPLEACYESLNKSESYEIDAASMGRRRLKNVCLSYLASIQDESVHALCLAQFEGANNMTDRLAALGALSDIDCPEREVALQAFENQFKDNALVMDKWFMIQAGSSLPDTLDRVKALHSHPAFDPKNPNKIRSLIGRFAMANPVNFHHESGRGYEFITDYVIDLDKRNPQVASRLVRALAKWQQFEPKRAALMKASLERIHTESGISNDVFEIVDKSLK
jgi:aminopeptidase N